MTQYMANPLILNAILFSFHFHIIGLKSDNIPYFLKILFIKFRYKGNTKQKIIEQTKSWSKRLSEVTYALLALFDFLRDIK